MKMKKIVLAWVLLGSFILAQKVTQVKFEGLAHISPSMAMEIADIHVGDQINTGKINESIKNLFSQGYFTDVWVDRKGGTLIYHFKEKIAVAKIDIRGYGTGDDGKKLLEGIGLKKGDLYDDRRAVQAKNKIIKKLESEGYYDTVVEVGKAPVGESSVALMFDVNKGEKIKIKKMNFVGASKISQRDLELELANKEEDFLGWMPFMNNGVAKVDQLEYDAYRVKDVYMRHGYLDAKVSKPLMRVDFGSYNAEVDYQVLEGNQYRVGEVSISQNIVGLNDKKLLGHLTLRKGKVFNIKRMRKDMEYLKEQVGNLGYAYAQVSPQMHKNPDTKTIDLQYNLQGGQEVTINDVLISGNDTTKDRVIRRYLYLAPGDKFNARDLKDSKNALGRTGFFEKVDIQSQRISADKINLLVNVKETSTGTISLGGGYGSYQKFMLNGSIADRNFLGSGINASVGFDISKISTNYNLAFVNPKLWDSLYSLSFSLYKKDYEYTTFTQDEFGGTLMLGRDFYRYFHASLGAGYIDNQSKANDNNKTSSNVEENYQLYYDKYKKASFYTSLSYDNTDDFYMPREGVIAAVNFEFANLSGHLSDEDLKRYPNGYGTYVRTSGKLGLYYGLEDWIDYDLILRFKARVTSISSGEGKKIPVGEKLAMGGIGSVRGYDPYSIYPRITDENGKLLEIRGKNRASGTVEASIPLSQAARMRLAAFYDYGMIGEDSFSEIQRSSAGVMVEWQSPMGPINLVFAKALDSEPTDRTSTFEFTMGTKF